MAEPKHISQNHNKGTNKNRALVLLLVVLLCCGLAGCAYLVWQQAEMDRAAQEQQGNPIPSSEPMLEENPVDFIAEKQKNPDIYAWIYIPGTNINLPVMQRAGDDSFYLDHNSSGEYAVEGSIYSQSMNSTDFSDPVTVLYGHNMKNGSMFTQLHEFEDPEFFANNTEIYIYTPGHILTYQIVAAYQYDNRHILNSFDFSDTEVRESYFASVLNPSSMLVNVREGATLESSDKIVQLSTCMGDASRTTTRYLVTGVLTNDQATK